MWIKREKLDELNEVVDKIRIELERVNNLAYLVGIERKGRENIFTFIRNGTVHKIVTMGLISDDLPKWKEELLR